MRAWRHVGAGRKTIAVGECPLRKLRQPADFLSGVAVPSNVQRSKFPRYRAGDVPSAFEHGYECRDGLISKIPRNLPHRCSRCKASDCDNHLQLLSPAAEGKARFALNETGRANSHSSPLVLPIAPSYCDWMDRLPARMRCVQAGARPSAGGEDARPASATMPPTEAAFP